MLHSKTLCVTFSMFPMNIKSVGATLGTTTETVTYQWPLVQHYTPGPGGDIGDRIDLSWIHGYMDTWDWDT